MPIIIDGSTKVLDLVVNGRPMDWGYHSDDIIYQKDQIIFESETPGTNSFVLSPSFYEIILVAGGGGGSSQVGGAGGYFHGKVWIAGSCSIEIGGGGNGNGGYCRNNSGESGKPSIITAEGVSINCPGGRYGCGRRECGDAGLTYAPIYDITNKYTIIEKSVQETRQESWYLTYGQGGNRCASETGSGQPGNNGYCMIKYVGRYVDEI